MYAQLIYFDGPRSAELVDASDRAGVERIVPALRADPDVAAAHHATYVLRQPDGSEMTIVIADTEEALQKGRETIRRTELLPGEDPALLTEPDRVEVYAVAHAFGRDMTPIEVAS